MRVEEGMASGWLAAIAETRRDIERIIAILSEPKMNGAEVC